MSNEYKDWYNDFSEEQKQNYELCMKYPILIPHHRWTGKVVEDYDYSWTELDAMPIGWRKAFGEDFAREVQETINKIPEEERDRVRINQIKEKYGLLCTYFSAYTDELSVVLRKYEDLSQRTCIDCGKPATKITTGWISPYCDECAEGKLTIGIDEYFKQWEDEDGDD